MRSLSQPAIQHPVTNFEYSLNFGEKGDPKVAFDPQNISNWSQMVTKQVTHHLRPCFLGTPDLFFQDLNHRPRPTLGTPVTLPRKSR